MADANVPPPASPPAWDAAFAAVPLERAPAGGWARLAAALPQPPSHAPAPRPMLPRMRLRVAFAAGASLALALPLAWWLRTSAQAPQSAPAAAAAVAGIDAPSRPPMPASRDGVRAVGGIDAASPPAAAAEEAPRRAAEVAPERASAARGLVAAHVSPRAGYRAAGAAANDPSPGGIPSATPPSDGIAATTSAAIAAATGPTVTHAPRLAALRRESARLEALVAYARDDRMASAPVAVMSASIDDRLRLIDSALMQPGNDDAQRSSLWSERVGALQELASLEGTQRWMAAHGASMDAVARVD